jgi:hypothetical protein
MKNIDVRSALYVVFFSSLFLTTKSQKTINVDSSYILPTKVHAFFLTDGQPYVNVKFARVVEGSPFFIDQWNKGYISTREGKKLRDVTLRLNLVDQQLHYLKDGIEYVTDQPLKEVLIEDEKSGNLYIFRSGFPSVQYGNSKTFYQALAEGEVLLLKHIRKMITENTPFGSATTQQTIRNAEHYYISKKGSMIKIRKDRQSILNALEDKKDPLEKFINQNRLNLRTEEDMIKLVNYYNAL